MYIFQINEPPVDQMFVFESFAEEREVVLAFLVGLKVQTILLYFFKSNSIDIKFAFSVLNGTITWKSVLSFLPVRSG
jgi:hypothetical protein